MSTTGGRFGVRCAARWRDCDPWYAAPVAVPHALFYVVILALPYWWWSGLLVVPALIVIGGLWRVASAHPLSGEPRLAPAR